MVDVVDPLNALKHLERTGWIKRWQEGKCRNQGLGLAVEGSVNHGSIHRYCLSKRLKTSRRPPKNPRKPSASIR
jgi:hypothetical protein